MKPKIEEAFGYGFLCSQIAAVLNQFLDKKNITKEGREALKPGLDLLKSCSQVIKLFEEGNCFFSEKDLKVFIWTLELIQNEESKLGIKNFKDLEDFIKDTQKTIGSLLINKEIEKEDLIKTKLFFNLFAKFMLSQLEGLEKGSGPSFLFDNFDFFINFDIINR